jgi:hypothetical protein
VPLNSKPAGFHDRWCDGSMIAAYVPSGQDDCSDEQQVAVVQYQASDVDLGRSDGGSVSYCLAMWKYTHQGLTASANAEVTAIQPLGAGGGRPAQTHRSPPRTHRERSEQTHRNAQAVTLFGGDGRACRACPAASLRTFRRLAARKTSGKIVATAFARELAGFLWAEMAA